MGTAVYSKPIDIAHFGSLNGGVGVTSKTVDGVSTLTVEGLTDAQLAAKLAAYPGPDPDWNDQDRKATRGIVAALKAGTATNAQLQKAVAWLVKQQLGS